jgi:polyisoprenoid-binding protein YceI
MKQIFTLSAACIFSVSIGFSQNWTMDKTHSQLTFTIVHMGINEIEGRFSNVQATLTASKDDLSDAVIVLSADIKSINTDNEQRDKNLKGADFFDADKYGILSFKSNSFKKVEGKSYRLTGELTIHGITRPVVLNVIFNGSVTTYTTKKLVSGFKVTGIIKRSEFMIASSYPPSALSDEVMVNANVEFVKD